MGVGAGLLPPELLGAGALELVVVLPELVPEDVDGLELVAVPPELLPEEVDGLVLPPEDPVLEEGAVCDVEGAGAVSAEKTIVPSSGLRVRRSAASTDTTDFIRRRDRAEVHLSDPG